MPSLIGDKELDYVSDSDRSPFDRASDGTKKDRKPKVLYQKQGISVLKRQRGTSFI